MERVRNIKPVPEKYSYLSLEDMEILRAEWREKAKRKGKDGLTNQERYIKNKIARAKEKSNNG